MVGYKTDSNLAALLLGAKSMLDLDKRPWGSWEEYLQEDEYRVKRLIILPQQQFSLQKHLLRSEYWVIVQGQGKLTLGSVQKILSPGDHAFIPIGCSHRLENIGHEELIVIETQLGICLEEDIVREKDKYGRT
jgi:mannose-6-phosphate isomerase